MKCAFYSFLILALINRGFPIRITRFVVPTVASIGAIVDLDCAYDLENHELYAVKWYKDADEFFRCRPDGQVLAFELEGIKLYHNHQATLGSCPVTLTALSKAAGGQYQCEVSTEGPYFKVSTQSVVLRISNIQPSRRIQNNGSSTSPTTENSIQKNGSRVVSPISFTYLLLFLYFVDY